MPQDMVFGSVRTKKKSVLVAEQIIQAIQQGVYKTGDRLPPERVIERETGVSKTSVREALSALQLAGIVERIAGSGTYVRSCGEAVGALSLLQQSESVEDALVARRLIETSLVELATERADEEQIDAIERIWEKMCVLFKDGLPDSYFALNEAFHLAIAEATGNPLVVKVLELLLQVTRQHLWQQTITQYFLNDDSAFQQSVEEHHQILAALRKRDKGMARKVMEAHFATVEKMLREG